MTMRNSLLTVLGSVMLLGAALPAHSESVLRIGLGADPDMLDPHLARTYYGRFVFASLCDRLVDVDENLKVVPGLAKDWAWSDDGKTLTLNLREGVTFHDGEKFDAAAAKYNLDRALTLKGSLRKSEISSVESVEVTGPMQIALHLKTPDAALLMQLTDRAGAMMAPEAAKKPDFAAHPVCSGPYKFDSRVSQDRIVLTRFDNYWNKDAYHFDKIIYLPIPDASVRLANLRAGDLDLTEGIAASDVKTVEADSKLALAKVTGLGYQGITFNINNGKVPANDPFRDARVREAFSQAIDRDALNQVVFEGLYTPANQAFSTVSPYHVNLPVPPRDVDKAKALLKAAGVTTPSAAGATGTASSMPAAIPAARSSGSRVVVNKQGNSLIINLPGQPKAIAETLEGLKDADGKQIVPGIFAAVPYCIDLIGGPYLETRDEVCKAFRPKTAIRPHKKI